MSFINKVKNFFYEDVEEDDDEFEAREALKREEKIRRREEKEKKRFELEEKHSKPIVQEANNDLSERELFKSEKTFNFPMDIDDDIFEITETMPIEKEETRKQVKEEKNIYARPTRSVTATSTRTTYKEESKVNNDEPKRFHPSPVVSPVYGILDKNYTVDDVVDKNLSKTKEFSLEKKTVDFDSVRNKAYKELDEEIEKTLTGNKDIFYNLEDEEKKEENTGDIDDFIEESYDKNENFDDEVKITYEGEEESKEEIEEAKPVSNDDEEEEEDDINFEKPDVEIPSSKEKKKRKTKNVETEEENEKEDLFNLIDNMYNEEDDEEEED